MKTRVVNRLIAITLIYLFSSSVLFAQQLLKEISLQQQIENSSLVVEGKVISKKSFWNDDDHTIYTANTIEVYKVFKGEPLATIEIITLGGTVGLQALIVNPSLKLRLDDIGVFTLQNNNVAINSKSKSINKEFRPYGSSQGFYKYNLYNDLAANSFSKKNGIKSSFYNEIKSYTKKDFVVISDFDAQSKKTSNTSKSLLPPSSLTLNKLEATAGTKEVLTITGSDFGATKGKVWFSNADDGGSTFISALDSQVNWGTNQITVEIPSTAGTGPIFIEDSNDDQSPLSSTLTISYSEINVTYDADDVEGGSNGPLEAIDYIPQHVNIDGNGGYTFQMYTGFNANTPAKEAFERAFNKWVCETGINWTIGTTTTVNVAEFESTPDASNPPVNVIRFDGGELDANTLGICYSWYKGCNIGGGAFEWFVAELDIVFNADIDWHFGPESTPAIIGKYDFESVALHELGHAHQLGHVIDNSISVNNGNDVMHYALQSVEDQRVLSANNKIAASNVQDRSNGPTMLCVQPLITNLSCPLSVEEDELDEAITIFPNPASNRFYVKTASAINLEKAVIYDISGRLILEHDISNTSGTKTISLVSVSQGIYFVNIYSDTAMITRKIAVE